MRQDGQDQRILSWLEKTNTSQSSFALQIGTARSVLWRWLDGKQTPRVDFAARMESLTDGAVRAIDWRPGRVAEPTREAA